MIVLYDWQCEHCGTVIEHGIECATGAPVDDRPKVLGLFCGECYGVTLHDRLFPRPQHYTKARLWYEQHGGKGDTMGSAPIDPLPRLQEGQSIKDLYHSKEYQDAKKKRREQVENNAAKRARARLKRAGVDIDLRVDRLPGDNPLIRE